MACVSIDGCEDRTECWPSACKADFVRILCYVPRYEIALFHFAVVHCSSFCENPVLCSSLRNHFCFTLQWFIVAHFVRILYYVPRYEITLFHFAVVHCSSFCENPVLCSSLRNHFCFTLQWFIVARFVRILYYVPRYEITFVSLCSGSL